MSLSNANYRRTAFWPYASVIFWICVIFFLSSPNGASTETSRFIRPLLEFFFPQASPELFETVHFIVRKTAHFTEYAVLGTLALWAATRSGWSSVNRHRVIAAILLVAAVAGLDEFNQSFEPSRTSSAWDSLLDIFGGTVAILAATFAARRRRR